MLLQTMHFSSYEVSEGRDPALYTFKFPAQVPVLQFKWKFLKSGFIKKAFWRKMHR